MLNIVALTCCVLAGSQDGILVQASDTVIAEVGPHKITEAHLQLVAKLSGHAEITARLRRELTKRLVETRLAGAYLKRTGYKVSRSDVSQAARDAKVRLKAGGVDLRAELKTLKLSEADLRAELEVGKQWNRFKVKTLTTEVIRARFLERKHQYDGTRVRASQIFMKTPANDGSSWERSAQELSKIREQVVAGKVTFADAAKKHSQSPSAKEGGDIGWFPYAGLMPRDFSQQAFALKKGQLSQPFRSRFGAHLVMVTDRDAGDLSLEDARPVIYRELEKEAWDRIVAAEKKATATNSIR